jgi:alpha-glucosidase
VPEQPLVQSTEETPEGPLTLRVYPPVAGGKACRGSLYLDDGVSYDFRKGEFLRMGFRCEVTAQGLTVKVDPHEGAFAPWWTELSIEVYGAGKAAAKASASALDGSGARAVKTAFDAEHHRISAVVPDDGKGLDLTVAY